MARFFFRRSWSRTIHGSRSSSGRAKLPIQQRRRLHLELLEGRCLPSTVTNLSDAGPGSLRDAIAATASGGMVDFQPGLSGPVTLTSASLTISQDITIRGPGADVIIVSGNNARQVFKISSATNVTISGLTIANGKAPSASVEGAGITNDGTLTLTNITVSGNAGFECLGGGIHNSPSGVLTVSNSTISDNRVEDSVGGGIFNAGALTISNSTVSGNSAQTGAGLVNSGTLTVSNCTFSRNGRGANDGGAISNLGTLSVSDSTFSDNSAIDNGGGIVNFAGDLTVTNSAFTANTISDAFGSAIAVFSGSMNVSDCTISGNRALFGYGAIYNGNASSGATISDSTISANSSLFGGGIYNGGTLMVSSSTVSGNMAMSAGGGIYNLGTLTAWNTIFAGNTVSVSFGPDFVGGLTSLGHNLIGNTDGTVGFGASDLLNVNPLLGPLQDNGGPTLTMAPLPGSPCIDAGDNTNAPDYDQRGPGFPRIVGGTIDIGALEVQAPPVPPGSTAGRPVIPAVPLTSTFPPSVRSVQNVSIGYAETDDPSRRLRSPWCVVSPVGVGPEGHRGPAAMQRLGRTIDPAGLSKWENVLPQGYSRAQMADAIMSSPDYWINSLGPLAQPAG